MKCVYSLSFFRHESSGYEQASCGVSRGIFFLNFVPAVVRAFHAVYGGGDWELRFHVDERIMVGAYGPVLQKYHQAGLIKLVRMGMAHTLCGSMLWRMAPLFEDGVDYVVCRDVDSLPMPRERKMFEEFEQSGLGVHAIHDSESHTGPLMGGMVSFKRAAFKTMMPQASSVEDLLRLGEFLKLDFNVHGTDQQFLNAIVYPRMAQQMMVHTRLPYAMYDCKTVPVAAQREPLDSVIQHIGAAFDVPKAIGVTEPMLPAEVLEKIRGCEA